MEILFEVNSLLNSITYILPTGNKSHCWLIDCGDVGRIIRNGWAVDGVLLTHTHLDHIYGLNKLLEYFPFAQIYTNEFGKVALADPKLNLSKYHDDVEDFVFNHSDCIQTISRNDCLRLSGMDIETFFTPGHDPSCISFRIGNDLFTGDSYIPRISVVANFPHSNKEDAKNSLARLKKMEQDGCTIHCGHSIQII